MSRSRQTATAAALLEKAATVLRGRPCDTCRWAKVDLIDATFEEIAAHPDKHRRVRFSTVQRLLNAEHGYPSTDPRTLRGHLAKCRPELWARVLAARPDYDLQRR